jgi:Peptidase M50B-like
MESMFAAGLAASLNQIAQVQAHLSASVAAVMAMVGIAAALVPGVWHALWPVSTMAHEGAHAVVGSVMGRKITGMEIKLSGGATAHEGDPGTLFRFPVTFAGYFGPSAFGIGAAELIRAGHIVAVLWIGLLGLIPVLYLARRSVGVLLVIAAVVALLLVLGSGSIGGQVLIAYAVTWFLLASGVRVINIRGADSQDAQDLKDMTGLPRGFWLPFWLAGTIAALIFGATLLL